jgi:putative nucleotidyltransferase with HDIG domain
MIRKTFFLLLFFSTLLFAEKKVLVLHSYHHGLEWSDTISRGIIQTLETSPEKIQIYFEYLDAKRYFTPYFQAKTFEYLYLKHNETRYDAVIVVDNDALAFVNKHYNILFINTPIIFCGINDFKPQLISNLEEVTGVKEAVDYEGVMALSLRLFPKRKKILTILDDTDAGIKIYSELKRAEEYFKDKVTFYNYNDFTNAELEEFIKTHRDEISTYLLVYNRDKEGKFYDYNEGILHFKKILGHTVPIFGSWDFYLNKGILGGVITLGFEQGKKAAQLTLEVLSGQPTSLIPILSAASTMSTIIDARQLGYFDLKKESLPSNLTYINEPLDFWSKYKDELIYFGVLFLVLCATILILFIRNIKYLRNITSEVTHIAASIAELKSRETAKHLRRVSLISFMLAKRLGVDKETCALIKIAAMLHDIGKVGIPDSILNKPGPLTKEEWEIMKTHASIGREMLMQSGIKSMKIASVIAHEHHERWDGTGYPNGKAGASIALVGRICAIADVFDSLLDKRVYKEPWTKEETKKYFETMSGKQFDPNITLILLGNFDTFIEARKALAIKLDKDEFY